MGFIGKLRQTNYNPIRKIMDILIEQFHPLTKVLLITLLYTEKKNICFPIFSILMEIQKKLKIGIPI